MFRLSLLLARRFGAGSRGRILLSIAGIALGVALGFAVQLVNQAAVNELAAGVRALSGNADLEVRGGRAGFPETLYATLAHERGVAVASPILELEAGLAAGGTLRLVGIDPLRAALIQPALFGDEPGRRLALLQPDTVYLSAAAAHLAKDGKLRIVAGLQTVELRVAGVLPASSLRGVAALTDVSTAQWRLGRQGQLNRIDLRLAPGMDRETLGAVIQAQLPAGSHVSTVDAVEESGANLSRAYRVNLNVLALVALFTGGFLVFSAQALEVARRRTEHALLRVMGLQGRGIFRLVLAESALIGAVGGALGIVLGWGIALAAVRLGGADLGSGLFRGVQPELMLPIGYIAAYWAAGIAVAIAGAWLPALDAARVPPAQALKAGDAERLFALAVSVTPGLVLLVLGAALAQLPSVGGLPLPGYLAIACLQVGGILLMPWLARTAFERLPLSRRPPLALALAQLRGAPGQAMVSLAAIVASFALMCAMAIMVASFRDSVDRWLGSVLPADLYFRTTHAGESGWIEPAFEGEVRKLPSVARVEFLRSQRVLLDSERPAVALLARDGVDGAGAARLPLAGRAHERREGDSPAAWISEAVSDQYRKRAGDRIELPLAGKPQPFVVAGVWRDYARQHGAIVIDRNVYVSITGDRRTNDAALWLARDATPDQVSRELRALPGGDQLEIAGPGEIRIVSLRLFDRTFAVTYALEAVAVLVGLFGLASSVGAIVLSRRREFGMLRHVGMTRGQVGAMLAAEGGLLAALGVGAGLLLGGAISLVLVFVVNRQSFGWSMDLNPPWLLLASLSAVLVSLAAAVAWISGREATGMAPVRAVREDW
ncbi:MAG: ABC transporter permease [Betaproteobacteria bacterium]|nr:ABC transporter permease [Betaproteobacteria bacterium]